MKSSPARAAASRANSRKSTGPKTERGRRASSQNARKHGLRAEVLALLPEERAELDARIAAWLKDERPATEIDAWLITHVAAASVKLDRCTEREAAALDEIACVTARAWLKKQKARARKRATKL